MDNSTYGKMMNSNSNMMSFYQDMEGGEGGYRNNACSMLEGSMGNGVEGELGLLEMLGLGVQIPCGYMIKEIKDHREVMSSSLPCNMLNHLFEDGNINAPGTPNSSSITAASNCDQGVAVESESEKGEEEEEEEEAEGDDEEEEQGEGGSVKSTKKQILKAKKGNLKKQRQPRFAFMTKTEDDHLEDGYRWRKYGQKAVKNSPFPRSYYRCTNASCGVKKRVERSCTDTSIVVTTYEGQHTHPNPLTPRSISESIFQDTAIFSAMPTLMQMNLYSRYQLQQPPSYCFASPLSYDSYTPSESLTTLSWNPSSTSFTHTHNNGNLGCNEGHGFIRDDGLLQDLIPSLVPKEE